MKRKVITIALLFAGLLSSSALLPVGPAAAQNQGRAIAVNRGVDKPMNDEIKILAEAQRAGFDRLFIAVAYDAGSYIALRGLSPQLPEVDSDLFRANAVVAVFLGQRPNGGYGIKIESTGPGGIKISETRPAPGAMVMQVLSSPFKVVAVPVKEGQALNVQLEPGMDLNAKRYGDVSGDFSFAGGVTGRQVKIKLGGTLTMFQRDKIVSVLFDLHGTGADTNRVMRTMATGLVDAQGRMYFGRVNPGTLVEFPYAWLKAQAAPSNIGLAFTFASLPASVKDGYEGQGSLQAKYWPAK